MLVVCVNAGNYLKRGREYVEKLHRGVRENLQNCEFVCFTDDPEPYADGIEKRQLPERSLRGWWHKLSLFKHGVFCDGERVLFLDLDTVVTGPLDAIADFDGEFAMLGPFFPNVSDAFAGNQSGVMTWRGGFGAEIWSAFEGCGFRDFAGGDQAFINALNLNPDILQEKFPGLIMSFKREQGREPISESIVCFHGLPRPHQCGGWVKDFWI